MRIKQYQIDAFANRLFEGNPAAVCPLDIWLPDWLMQAIATENNLSETAFFVPEGDGYRLRWFTPVAEVDLCGHATMAAAHVILNELEHSESSVAFETRSGRLTVIRDREMLTMNFPVQPPNPVETPDELIAGLGITPIEVLAADDYIAIFDDEETIRTIFPDLAKLKELKLRGVCVSAPGDGVDFVSRFFAPKLGIAEDPVTGSAHCELIPYWSSRLGKTDLTARQVSKRGGYISCHLADNRIILSGRTIKFMEGWIEIGDIRGD